jgi:hypothetical protein
MHTDMLILFLTKATKPCNGEKKASSTNGAWKSGYLPGEN